MDRAKLLFVTLIKVCQTENRNVESPYLNPKTMKSLIRLALPAVAGLLFMSPAEAGSTVARAVVRDLYPRVVQQIVRPGSQVEYRPALSSAYRPDFYAGYGVYRPDYGYGDYGLPGRRFYPVGTGYPNYYRPGGNYGVDAILYPGSRGKFGIPGYGLRGGAFPRPVVRPQLQGLPPARYSGNVKGRE